MTRLPQLDRLFIADAGLETDLIYNRGIDLPYFASIALHRDEVGEGALKDYFREFIALATRNGVGCLLETASWRASPDWAEKLGLSNSELDALNRRSVEFLKEIREEGDSGSTPILISGCIGPRGDGYDPGNVMTSDEAENYHSRQVSMLASVGPDLISALTMTNVAEAIGIARAAQKVGLPVVISFTVETDGRLPTGQPLQAAIEAVDEATDGYPTYYMVNCAHPTHFGNVLEEGGAWTRRIGGIRANASKCSHAELDRMTELDIGDPDDLGRLYAGLRRSMPWLNVLGGCCGTDIRHVTAIAEATVEREAA